MGLSSAMNTGVSGLSINAEAITVVGNNISNVNTIGFKEGRMLFSDMLSQNIGAGQVGRGAQIQAVQNNFTQGSFENTSNDTDLAIQGDSFFVVQNSQGTQYYTRAGAFNFNNSNVLTNADGYTVMGYGINQATGASNGVLGAIDKTAFATLAAKQTSAAKFVLNLDSTQSMPGSNPTTTVNLTGDFGTAAPPANTTFNIYDEFGNAHAATVTWNGASPNYGYSIQIAGVQNNTPGSAASPITGTLSFPSVANPPTQTLIFSNGAKSQPLNINFSSMQNTVAGAVAPTASQDGTAGQKTGTVSISGGTNVAGPAVASYTTDTGLTAAAGATTITLTAGKTDLLTLGMTVTDPTVNSIPAGTVITGISGNTITLSNAIGAAGVVAGDTLTFSGNGYAADAAAITTGSTTITPATMPANVVVGQYVAGTGIPANTYITAIDTAAGTITLSNAATATNAAASLNYSSNVHFDLVDSTGTVRSGAWIPPFAPSTVWQAVVDGASNTISGSLTAGSGSSTWTQNTSNFTINGVSQNVAFDFGLATSASTAPTVSATGFDKTTPSTTANFSNTIQVYDALGNAHNMTVYYRKTGATTWEYHAIAPDAVSINGMAGNSMISGTLNFNSSGALFSQTPSGSTTYSFQFGGGVASQPVTIDFGAGLSTQTASASAVTTQNQDGFGAGTLVSTGIDNQGYVTATYSNNQIQRMAQVVTAKFASVDGLEKSGNSLYSATTGSGTALLGTIDSQGGKIMSKSLEQSNVDIATQLVKMIQLQRAYSANSKTITTADEMTQEVLNLKR